RWSGAGVRMAGISSFGVGGTNAHVIVAQPPHLQPSGVARPWQLLPVSHQSAEGLERQEAALLKALPQQSALADVACTLQTGRGCFREMAFVIANTTDGALQALTEKKS